MDNLFALAVDPIAVSYTPVSILLRWTSDQLKAIAPIAYFFDALGERSFVFHRPWIQALPWGLVNCVLF